MSGSSPVRTASLQSKIRKSSDSQRNQGFFVSRWKQNIAFLRSLSGANSGSFFRDNKKAPEMYNTSLIIMFLLFATNLKTKCDIQPNQNVNNLHLLVQNEM